jgi:hypothetical protein
MSTSTQGQDQVIICNLLAQRTRFLSLLTPRTRFVPVSPYPTYNQKQLDMRRKIEVLKYDKNSTQASKITKSQKWSQLVNNNLGSGICNKNYLLPTPSSSCDVPGPLTYLTYDPNVPLYNYSSSKDVYANYTETINIPWSTKLNTETQKASNLVQTNIFTLAIQDAPNSSYNFNFTLPIGIYISGNNTNNVDIAGYISVTSALLNVYYYNGKQNTLNTPIYTQEIKLSSSNYIIFENRLNDFEAVQYIRNISFPNIQLNSHYSYVYDFDLTFNIQNNTPSNVSISNLTYGVFLNASKSTTSVNCIVSPNPTISNYQPFSFNGV